MTNAPLDRLMIFTGNANPRLAQDVAKHLNLSIGRAIVGKFSDGEVMVELLENVRGKDVFVLQSTCAPTNDNLMELLVMVDALKRSSAARVTAAIANAVFDAVGVRIQSLPITPEKVLAGLRALQQQDGEAAHA